VDDAVLVSTADRRQKGLRDPRDSLLLKMTTITPVSPRIHMHTDSIQVGSPWPCHVTIIPPGTRHTVMSTGSIGGHHRFHSINTFHIVRHPSPSFIAFTSGSWLEAPSCTSAHMDGCVS
jgi:hypothetical protein